MSSHKRTDSGITMADPPTGWSSKSDFDVQTQPVQAFFESAKKLAAHDGQRILQALLERVQSLEQALKEKTNVLDGCAHFNKELNAANRSLEARDKASQAKVSDVEQQCKELKAVNAKHDKNLQVLLTEKQGLGKTLGEMQRQLQESDKLTNDLRKEVNEKELDLAKRVTEVERLQKSELSSSRRCKKLEQDLSEIQRLTTRLSEEDQSKMTERMAALWQMVTEFVLAHFGGNLPDVVLENKEALNQLKQAVPNFPLPWSNSLPAKQMRFAAIVSVTIKAMYDHLFLPTYVFGEGPSVQDTLMIQAQINVNQERLCRSVLLSILPDDQTQEAEARIDHVVDDVWDIVKNMTTNGDRAFHDLEQCVEFAYETWSTSIKAKNLYHLSFEPCLQDDQDWTTMDLPADGSEKRAQQMPVHTVDDDDVVLQVFPRVYVVEDPMKPLNSGIALRRYQTSAAKKEVKEESSSAPSTGTVRPKPTSGRARRKSIPVTDHSAQRQSAGNGKGIYNH